MIAQHAPSGTSWWPHGPERPLKVLSPEACPGTVINLSYELSEKPLAFSLLPPLSSSGVFLVLVPIPETHIKAIAHTDSL